MPDHRHLLGGVAVMTDSPAYVHGFTFSGKEEEVIATRPEQVVPALEILEERVASGLHAAGFLSYEAAEAINGDLTTLPSDGFPLLWFGVFRNKEASPFPAFGEPFRAVDWESSWQEDEFSGAVGAIRELIAAGDCYQVNLTMRQRFLFSGCPRSFFSELCRSQPTPYNSYLEAGRYRVLSASPELFFSLSGGVLTTRPMKGTAPRGRWHEEDEARKRMLRESPKEMAENLMIVDLLRNDMGIVSETGSVQVSSLFDVESHPTVHQMTSTIQSRVREDLGFVELMKALFPCGSVTGAPKRRSMEIIADLEREPRGLYTGCLGYVSPGSEMQFSVAIRTAVIDVESGRGVIGIGSGITYDSKAADEYAECISKGKFARKPAPAEFYLIESFLYDGGYFLLERHMERLAHSADYFSFPLNLEEARQALKSVAEDLSGKQKVRLLLYKDGRLSCEAAPIQDQTQDAIIGFAEATITSADPFLYHKTSRRQLYREQLAKRPDLADVIFLNERGEVTEGTYTNVVAKLDGEFVTPPLSCGLLPGVFREELLASGELKEKVITERELEEAQEIYIVNSVRQWRRAKLEPRRSV